MRRRREELGRRFNPLTFEEGSGNYIYLKCGTFEEQNGCVYPIDGAALSPPAKWMTIEDLGATWRLKNEY